MRADFTLPFTAEKNKLRNKPVTLMQLDWPALNGLPALTLRLSDRSGISIDGVPWFPLIENPGDIQRLVNSARLLENPSSQLRASLINFQTSLFSPPAKFSYLYRMRPPEAATVRIFQWFDKPGMTSADMAELFVASIEDPNEATPRICALNLVNISSKYGRQAIGNVVDLEGYPLAPESSVGSVKPIPIGLIEKAPTILVRKSQQTILKSVAIPGATIVTVASTENFPAAGTIIINDDEIAYTAINSTQFLNCTGINEFHYADDTVLEKVTDHRYLIGDPSYPIKSISNVRVKGELADVADYTIDLVNGEIIFNKKPQGSDSFDTKFLQIQNDTIGPSNTATDAAKAFIPNSPSTYAKISQLNSILGLIQSDVISPIGEIGKVLLRIEYFAEEKLPNDTLEAHIVGIGKVGDLSTPALDDTVTAEGTSDFTHDHLDTFGFPITDPQHQHTEALPPKITQNASTGIGGNLISKTSGQVHTITFFDPGPGTWATGEYAIGYEWGGTIVGNPVAVNANGGGGGYQLWHRSGTTETYSLAGNMNSAHNTVTISHSASNISFYIRYATRVITMSTPNSVSTQPTNTSTSKSGDVTGFSGNVALNSTAEKSTQSVVNFIDITSHVNGDWNWFTGKEAQVKYVGSSDGRTVFIIHFAYEIEYARRRVEFSDDVTADVEGVKDDALGAVTGVADSLIEKPVDVFKWSILKLLGLSSSFLDNVSLDNCASLLSTAVAGGYKLAGIIQNKIEARALWQVWGKSCRSWFYWDLGKVKAFYRPLSVSSTSTVPDKAISSSMMRHKEDEIVFKSKRTRMDKLANHIDLNYQRDYSSEEYLKVENAIDAESISLFGKREDVSEFSFDWIRNQVMAVDLVNFYLAEKSMPTDEYTFEAYLDNMELERGDIIWLPSPLHELDNVQAMIIGAGRSLGSGKAQKMDSVGIVARLMGGVVARPGFGQHSFGDSPFGAYYSDMGLGRQAFGSTGFGGVEKN